MPMHMGKSFHSGSLRKKNYFTIPKQQKNWRLRCTFKSMTLEKQCRKYSEVIQTYSKKFDKKK